MFLDFGQTIQFYFRLYTTLLTLEIQEKLFNHRENPSCGGGKQARSEKKNLYRRENATIGATLRSHFHQESVLQKKVSRTIKKSISHANTPTRIQLQRKWFFFKCSLSCTENSVKFSHYIIHQHLRWPVSQLSKHRELYSFLLLTERGRARVINSFIDH